MAEGFRQDGYPGMMRQRKELLLALGAGLLVGCESRIDSPEVRAQQGVAAVEPDVVCAEQLTTSVTLHGDGFTPMPSKTLEGEGTTQLILPEVRLLRQIDLDGKAAVGDVRVPDDAAQPQASKLKWLNQQTMVVEVSPELKLPTGVYDIKVTNPDGVRAATFTQALAAVPRPTLKQVAPGVICNDDEDVVLTLTGSELLQVGDATPMVRVAEAGGTEKDFLVSKLDDCKDIGGTHAKALKRCTTATFTIPKGTFQAGGSIGKLLDIKLTNPSPASCASTDAVQVALVPSPTVASVMPDLICSAQGDDAMKVSGTGFLKVGASLPKVTVGDKTFTPTSADKCQALPTPAQGPYAEGEISSCTELSFTIPQGSFGKGDFDVSVTNPEPADCKSKEKVTLHVAPPPVITSVEPDLFCDAQEDQGFIVKGSEFLKVGDKLPVVRVGTEAFTPTKAEGCVDVPGKFVEGVVQACTSLTITIPKSKLPEGDYPVVVENPGPADCKSVEAITVHVAPPPVIDSLATASLCTEDEQVTITGKKFLKVGDKPEGLPTVKIGDKTFSGAAITVNSCKAIPGTFVEGVVSECTSISVKVAKGEFPPGEYAVVVTNPLPADCFSEQSIKLRVVAPPTVDAIIPAAVCAGGSTIKVTGTNLTDTTTVTLSSAGKPDVASVSSDANAQGTELTVSIGAGGEVGTTYDVTVSNGSAACSDKAPHKTVTIVPGPIAFFADPEVIYNGVNTGVTVYVTGLTPPLPATGAIQIVPAGQAAPVTDLQPNAVPGHPNRFQVVVPKGQAPGEYDLLFTDATGCPSRLDKAVRVVADLTVSLESMEPSFGWKLSDTAASVFRNKTAAAPANKPFVATPRVFLNPANAGASDIAISLSSVSFVDDATLTSVVPRDQPVKTYDLITVNPSGEVGLLKNAFSVKDNPPPTISTVTPSSLVSASGQSVTVSGSNFVGSKVSLTCRDGNGAATPAPATTSGAVSCDAQQKCSQQATIDASSAPAGSVCVLRVTNADGSYADFSALGVTTPSLNLSQPHKGPDMKVGRRALVAAAGNATAAARFVYAIGGDGGAAQASQPFDSVEFAAVDLFGNLKPWAIQPYKMAAKRSFASVAQLGRYIYVFGGFDGANPLASAERALILSPQETPKLDVSDIVPNDQGLDPGYWYYKVSAVFDATDTDNPGGESLPSDEFIVKVPTFPNKKIQVVLSWKAPTDSAGAPLPNVVGYRLYRTAAANGTSGGEVLLKTFDAATLTFTDDGSTAPGTEKPLPLGSTGKFAQLPAMATARQGAAGAVAADPADPTKFHVYALLGKGASQALTGYEYLTVTVAPNGRQSAAATWKTGAQQAATGRWQLGAFVADHTTSDVIPVGTTYIYLGGGLPGTGNTKIVDVDAGKVAAGGDLGAFDAAPSDFKTEAAGYGVCAANNQLFTFGGLNGAPSPKAKSGEITGPGPGLANNAWNDEGLNMTEGRYLMGSAVQSAFIFLLGGQTSAAEASVSTELVIW